MTHTEEQELDLRQRRTRQALVRALEALLLPFGYFFSPVKGMIINFHEVVKMTEEDFILSSGNVIHITRRKYKEARDAYTRFRFDKIRREVEN